MLDVVRTSRHADGLELVAFHEYTDRDADVLERLVTGG